MARRTKLALRKRSSNPSSERGSKNPTHERHRLISLVGRSLLMAR